MGLLSWGGCAAGEFPSWAYPGAGPEAKLSPEPLGVPGSALRRTLAQADDADNPVDWFPDSHPPMPLRVARGKEPNRWACSYCHLPDGSGRPENASLAGLPAAYILQQVEAFRSGSRRSAAGASDPLASVMPLIAQNTSPEEADAAARYFAGLKLHSKVRVVECSVLPRPQARAFLYVVEAGAPPVPIDGRIIEGPDDFQRHELHDPTVTYTACVPLGSLARGRQLAQTGPAGPATACALCHGPDLRGTSIAPPIAGRFATYVLRQLLALQSGTRNDSMSILMHPVVAPLSQADMVALSAYVASLQP